jgi:hypothetical protein
MKTSTIMKTLKGFSYSIIATIAFFFSTNSQVFANGGDADSTVINIDKRNQTLLNQKSGGKTLRENLQELFIKSGMSLDDDTWRGIRRVVNSDLNKDTLLVITQSDKSIKVVINTNSKNGNNESVNTDHNGDKRDNKDKQVNGVIFDKDGLIVKSGVKHEVRISTNGVYVNDGGEETKIVLRDSIQMQKKDRSFNSRSGFNIYFGLNSFTNTGSIPATDSKNYELSPFGSRYFGFGWTRSGLVSKGTNAAFKISYGLEFSWYNFMFENDNYIVKGPNEVGFQNYPDPNPSVKTPIALCRNKLTVANINIPVMPYVAFKKGSTITYIAAGGYVGYRLDSYTKTKEDDSGKKQWNHSSFYLNNVRYGLAFELGLKNFPDLFMNYDMTKLFQDGKGPKVGGLSFGIRL